MSRMSTVFGLMALALVLVVIGLAYTAIKWLLIVAVVLFLLGVVRAFFSSRRDGRRGGPDAG